MRHGIKTRLAAGLMGLSALGAGAYMKDQTKCNCGEKQKIEITSAGQAAASAAVLQFSDIGSASEWTGGQAEPLTLETDYCKGEYDPKQADLVRIGNASTSYVHKTAGLAISSDALVMQSPQMVQLHMQRTAQSPKLLGCLSRIVPSTLDGQHFVSIKRLSFPHVGNYTAAWRVVSEDDTTHRRIATDQIVIGRGSTEIVLTVAALSSDTKLVKPVEVKMARTLVGRIRA
jgi:hypothetical protein